MNWADSEKIAAVLEDTEYKPASKIEDADLIVVNMCSVRQSAVDRVMGLKEKIKNKKTIITGCVLKKDWLKLEKQFGKIIDIKEFIKKAKGNYFKKITSYVPIMTGCNNFCAYCVVPYTRGREISRPVKEIICEIKNLVKTGAKEIWLLGQNVNNYKHNTPPPSSPSKREISPPLPPLRGGGGVGGVDFPELLKIVNDIPGGFWIRFTSPHPKDFSDELINTMAKCEKLGEYLNLPVQAGDNQILKKMNRGYNLEHYIGRVNKIRALIPHARISTDIIVGFPGETEKQFQNTLKALELIKFNDVHMFAYSARPTVAAEKFPDQLPETVKQARLQKLIQVVRENLLCYNAE